MELGRMLIQEESNCENKLFFYIKYSIIIYEQLFVAFEKNFSEAQTSEQLKGGIYNDNFFRNLGQ